MIPNLRLRVSTPLVDLLTIPIFLVFSTAISYVLISRCLGWMCISLIESFLKLFKTLCTFYGSKFGWRATLRHAVQRGHVTATVRVVACRQLESDRISSLTIDHHAQLQTAIYPYRQSFGVWPNKDSRTSSSYWSQGECGSTRRGEE